MEYRVTPASSISIFMSTMLEWPGTSILKKAAAVVRDVNFESDSAHVNLVEHHFSDDARPAQALQYEVGREHAALCQASYFILALVFNAKKHLCLQLKHSRHHAFTSMVSDGYKNSWPKARYEWLGSTLSACVPPVGRSETCCIEK